MTTKYAISVWIAELAPFLTALIACIYGAHCFFRKGRSLYLQCLTLAMGCYALGSTYHIVQMFTIEVALDGFTPAYLGKIGFFLFFLTANYGCMDKLIDDGTQVMKKYRYIALIAPVLAALIYVPNIFVPDASIPTNVTMIFVWIPAMLSLYFGFKHAIIPDMGFGFVKAIRPFNILATCLGLAELSILTAWNFLYDIPLIIAAIAFAVLCVAVTVAANKGVKKWVV